MNAKITVEDNLTLTIVAHDKETYEKIQRWCDNWSGRVPGCCLALFPGEEVRNPTPPLPKDVKYYSITYIETKENPTGYSSSLTYGDMGTILANMIVNEQHLLNVQELTKEQFQYLNRHIMSRGMGGSAN